MGLVSPQHVASSRTRDWTGVPCFVGQILNHWTIREIQLSSFYSPAPSIHFKKQEEDALELIHSFLLKFSPVWFPHNFPSFQAALNTLSSERLSLIRAVNSEFSESVFGLSLLMLLCTAWDLPALGHETSVSDSWMAWGAQLSPRRKRKCRRVECQDPRVRVLCLFRGLPVTKCSCCSMK